MTCQHQDGGEIKDHASQNGTSVNLYCTTCGKWLLCMDEGDEHPIWVRPR